MNVQIPTDQRINMSLEDLIKADRRQKHKGGKPQQQQQKKAAPRVSANPAANAARVNNKRVRNNNRGNNRPQSSAMDVETNRAAKSVGESKAKRNAQINARRGLQTSVTPTKKAVKQEVNKQLARAGASSGLKISFKPGELNKTTERAVSQQIRAVLARQTSPGGRPASANSAASANSNGGQRRGPKGRGKKVMHVAR